MYKVETYDVKCSVRGTKTVKMDTYLTNIINEHEAEGWELVSMTELGSKTKNFTFQMVFKKAN
ncbi:MAG: DUF4177 domain-containing protein [Clostridia bacterium]|nr:DUF4177 domain-containing protein [Clostridia bacterium]